MTITEFLTARYDEEEAVARRHAHRFTDDSQRPRIWNGPGQYPVMTGFALMADIAAKRAIVELHEPVDEEPDGWCNLCDGDGWPCGTMALLAQPYAEHADFDPTWRTT